jgi:hypothetical protein
MSNSELPDAIDRQRRFLRFERKREGRENICAREAA